MINVWNIYKYEKIIVSTKWLYVFILHQSTVFKPKCIMVQKKKNQTFLPTCTTVSSFFLAALSSSRVRANSSFSFELSSWDFSQSWKKIIRNYRKKRFTTFLRLTTIFEFEDSKNSKVFLWIFELNNDSRRYIQYANEKQKTYFVVISRKKML